MQSLNNSDKQVRSVILIFILINTIFLAVTRLFPFIDLPNHLAEATIYKYYQDGNLLSQYYKPTPWYFPNTFHTVFCSLFPSVESGNKVFHILYIVLLQASMFLAIRQVKGNAWYGLLAFLFTYNYNVTFGFVGFAFSIPLLIFLFYVILHSFEKHKLYLDILTAFLLVMLFFMHAQNALLGVLIFGIMTLVHYRKSIMQAIWRALIIPIPLLIFIVTWWFTRTDEEAQSTVEHLKEYYSSEYFTKFFIRFRIVVFDNFQLREGLAGLVIASLFFLCIFIPIFASWRWRDKIAGSFRSPEMMYAGIFFLIILACYTIAPPDVPGQMPIFQRFCTIVILSFIILSSILLRNVRLAWLKYFVCLAAFAYTLLWFEYMHRFNRQNNNFNAEFFADISQESTLAGLIYENDYRGRKVYLHFPNYFIVWKKGIAASKIIDYRFGVVRRVAPIAELPLYEEFIGEIYSHQSTYSNVDYLLVRGNAPVKDDINVREFSLWRESEPWKLFKKLP